LSADAVKEASGDLLGRCTDFLHHDSGCRRAMANFGLLKQTTMQCNSVKKDLSGLLLVGAEATILLNIVVTLRIMLAFRAEHVPIALVDGKLIDSCVCRYVQLFGVLVEYRERERDEA
jgi:hypothetical protein